MYEKVNTMRLSILTVAALLVFSSLKLHAEDIMPSNLKDDLSIEAKLLGGKVVGPGQAIGVEIAIVNRSEETEYPIVKPGDGSECGWREPYVFFTARRKTDAGWEAAPKAKWGRCGLFDHNWQDDIAVLKPGDRLALKDWLSAPSHMLEIQKPGDWQLFVHYRYSRGGAGKGVKLLSDDELNDEKVLATLPENMKGVPAFELVSQPLEFTLVRNLDLKLTVKEDLKVKSKTSVADILNVAIVNTSDKAETVVTPTVSGEARLRLEIEGEFNGWAPMFPPRKGETARTVTLKPGESISVLGDAAGLQGEWEYPVEDTVKVRAVFTTTTWKPGQVIISDWVELKVR